MKRNIRPATLRAIWRAYSAAQERAERVRPSTLGKSYREFEHRIQDLPDWVESSDHCQEYLLDYKRYSPETTRRTLEAWSAATKWAIRQRAPLIGHNPFEALDKIRRARKATLGYEAFLPEERDAIFEAFRPAPLPYRLWIRALFWLGARPEEVRALRWADHVSPRRDSIEIRAALPMGVWAEQDTKNGKHTRIKGSQKLEKLLAKAYTLGSPYCFPAVKGGPFHYSNFQRRWWRPIVSRLASEGAIGIYLSEYHARHTWISGALDKGLRPADVAYLARTDVSVIYRHYLGRSRDLDFPDI